MGRKKNSSKKLERIEQEEHVILKKIERIEKEEERIEKEQGRIEKLMDWKFVHGIQLSRAFVGSILGIALSSYLFGIEAVRTVTFTSAWIMFGLAAFAAFYISYKTGKGLLSGRRKSFLPHVLLDVGLYIAVAFAVSYVMMFSFGVLPVSAVETFKFLLVFALPAIAGALTLTIM